VDGVEGVSVDDPHWRAPPTISPRQKTFYCEGAPNIHLWSLAHFEDQAGYSLNNMLYGIPAQQADGFHSMKDDREI